MIIRSSNVASVFLDCFLFSTSTISSWWSYVFAYSMLAPDLARAVNLASDSWRAELPLRYVISGMFSRATVAAINHLICPAGSEP